MDYITFLRSKQHLAGEFGFDALWTPDSAFPFQKFIIEKACTKGRHGLFVDTGLGKTLIQLSIAHNIVKKTNGKVLILTPLAVAFQFVQEAERIGVPDVTHSKDGSTSGKIIIANYERLHLFDWQDFQGVMLDESSILKNFAGRTRDDVIAFMRKIPYRFLSTATPSPNDFIELGNSAEALGHMGYMDMLGRFFKTNQNSIDSNNRNIGEKFYLKPHAEKDFFMWVASWSTMVRLPSDLGFSNDGYNLPELITNVHSVKNAKSLEADGQMSLFNSPVPAKSMTEVREEQRLTVEERCETAFNLADGKTSVYWTNRNDESELLARIDTDAAEIKGSMTIEQKEEILIGFANGEIKRLITKPKMTSMGLNWQHCNHTVFFPTWSYEQYYQSVRRFWRFGQKNPVTVDLVISEGQERVMQAIQQKAKKAQDLYRELVDAANSSYEVTIKEFDKRVIAPSFL